MFNWLTSLLFWRSNPVKGPVLGPARNASETDDGRVIKAFLEQSIRAAETKESDKKPQVLSPQVVVISTDDINKIRSGLRKVSQESKTVTSETRPLFRELKSCSDQGYKVWFEQLRQVRRVKAEEEHRRELDDEIRTLLELEPLVVTEPMVIPGPLVYIEDIIVPKVEVAIIECILAENSIKSEST